MPPSWKVISSGPAAEATATWAVTCVSLLRGTGKPTSAPQLLAGLWKKTPAQLHVPVLMLTGVVYGAFAMYWKTKQSPRAPGGRGCLQPVVIVVTRLPMVAPSPMAPLGA